MKKAGNVKINSYLLYGEHEVLFVHGKKCLCVSYDGSTYNIYGYDHLIKDWSIPVIEFVKTRDQAIDMAVDLVR